MSDLTLVIGNKNYSSWSMRGGLVVRLSGAAFKEIVVPLQQPDTASQMMKYSPSRLVPALHDGDFVVWDSLAIAEYLAEKFPEKDLWPRDAKARAIARSVCAEMHGGFTTMRKTMPMNMRRRFPGRGVEASRADLARVQEIWRYCRARYNSGGPFLFGAATVADAFYAPVVSRFVTYEPPLDDTAKAYVAAIAEWPVYRDWLAAAEVEPWLNPDYEFETK